MNDTWNDRYNVNTFVYGTEPNAFFKEEIDRNIAGRILMPADGEGRNGVYAAIRGYEVEAFDLSSVAMAKAEMLAKKHRVRIHYTVADCNAIDTLYPDSTFDYIALIYAHFPSDVRRKYHQNIFQKLKPGGKLIFEAFSKKQLPHTSGGPKNEDLLYSTEELIIDFESLSKIEITENEVLLDEGELHRGTAYVIRLLGVK